MKKITAVLHDIDRSPEDCLKLLRDIGQLARQDNLSQDDMKEIFGYALCLAGTGKISRRDVMEVLLAPLTKCATETEFVTKLICYISKTILDDNRQGHRFGAQLDRDMVESLVRLFARKPNLSVLIIERADTLYSELKENSCNDVALVDEIWPVTTHNPAMRDRMLYFKHAAANFKL